MVPVASYHAAHVVDGDLLPGFVPDVLPARDFLQHEKADFVAGVKKMTRLRIMRGANDVAPELFTQDLRVAALSASRHGLPDKHGQAPKELYGSQWSTQGKANLLAVDNLRYRLMPYIYSLAWMVTSRGYTIMRPLLFDFQNDTKVYGIDRKSVV